MAEQSITLNPSESKMVSFEAIPHDAKVYQVSVNGLSGSFVAMPAALELVTRYGFSVVSFDGKKFIEVGVDPDGIPYGVLSEPAMVVSTYVTNTMPFYIHWRLAPAPTLYPFKYYLTGKIRLLGFAKCPGCVLSYSEGWTAISGGPGTVWENTTRCLGAYHDTCSVKGTCYGNWTWEVWKERDGYARKIAAKFRIKNMLTIL